MAFDPLTAVLTVGSKIIDKIFPDAGEREKAKLTLAKMQMDGELNTLKTEMSVMLAEAQSADPWTSRARPSFLYCMYLLILAAIPMGILSAFNPDMATQIAGGMKAWLAAIPDGLWATFGIGYSGYTIARSAWDKKK